MVTKRKSTVKEIQQLAGYLNFLNKATFTGRAFTRRMYAKYAGLINNTTDSRLQVYHHIKLDREFKSNCRTWLQFLELDTLAVVSRPYVDLSEKKEVRELEFYSDASLNENFGISARFEKQWTYMQWPEGFVRKYQPSIEFVELYGLTIAVYIRAKKLRNQHALIFCDNEAVVHMINNSALSCPLCMKMIRGLVLKGLQYNFRLFAQHVRIQDNQTADALSRLQFDRFAKLAQKLRLHTVPEPIPQDLLPVHKFWEEEFYL